jgi:hypothetical protein
LQQWLVEAPSKHKVLLGPLGADAVDKLHALIAVQHHQPAALALTLAEAHGVELVLRALITPRWLHIPRSKGQQQSLARNEAPLGRAHSVWIGALQAQFDAAPRAIGESLRAAAETYRPQFGHPDQSTAAPRRSTPTCWCACARRASRQ